MSPTFIRASPNGVRIGGWVTFKYLGWLVFPGWCFFGSFPSVLGLFGFLLRFDVVAWPAQPLEVAQVVCTPPGVI